MRTILKKRNRSRNRKGVSLAELLFAIGLMAFVATAAIGGIVVVSRVKETIDKQAKANMIMIATVSYLRADLNCCTNPAEMNCTYDDPKAINSNGSGDYYPVFYNINPASGRYLNYLIRNEDSGPESCSGSSAKVQYYNTDSGICVALQFTGIPPSVNGITAPAANRKYILGQNVMDGTGMISRIGGNGKINYNNDTKLFEFTVEVVDAQTKEVILSQDVKVCPDTLMPSNP